MKVIKQLIQFIQSIPFSNDEVYISKPEQADAVKLYYEKIHYLQFIKYNFQFLYFQL